eukprot:CAMPEP_0172910566 /NCGR_PEP_ID=MMETSP1075-20121228/184860_1 /TAXON_ID=2916 /ORGANISM="Ceratium fusus, Strain PA161109" /LENGTH=149 /DNA_ID=CAMNT_0013768727 /DNA_START=17 /DNA_END=463 /DNA_ORIENTATION=-
MPTSDYSTWQRRRRQHHGIRVKVLRRFALPLVAFARLCGRRADKQRFQQTRKLGAPLKSFKDIHGMFKIVRAGDIVTGIVTRVYRVPIGGIYAFVAVGAESDAILPKSESAGIELIQGHGVTATVVRVDDNIVLSLRDVEQYDAAPPIL